MAAVISVSLIASDLPHAAAQESQHQGTKQRQYLPRPFKCPICWKAFRRLEHQTRHIRTHTGEKPHVCQFPRCTKGFSRKDELIRHSKVHNNSNSRRRKNQQATAAKSAPNSSPISANVWLAQSHNLYLSGTGSVSPYHGSRLSSMTGSPNSLKQPPEHKPFVPQVSGTDTRHQHLSCLCQRPSCLSGLAQYSISSKPTFRSHIHEQDDQQARCMTKKSRSNSPFSTDHLSPSFSHASISPTSDRTPLATPAHSPRIRPHGWSDIQLPQLRNLSIHLSPALVPLEPQTRHNPARVPSAPAEIRFADIISNTKVPQRKLPFPAMPKFAV